LFKIGHGANPLTTALEKAEVASADKRELAETSLDAHRLLMELNAKNIPRFKDVTRFLKEDLEQ
ncbi:MAG: hypothetical protein VX705_08305, partial [Verrucomicrobiota bacterium]|nr:hypothetical protein [Verrucomicrobiota bacterium]